MSRSSVGLAATTLLLLAACGDPGTGTSNDVQVSNAFSSVPAGYDNVQSSFAASVAADSTGGRGLPWMPRGRDDRRGGPGMGDFMGGGLGADFIGAIDVGHGFGHGPFGGDTPNSACTSAAASGDLTCIETRDGVTVTRVATYETSAGVTQQKPDTLTNSVRLRITASGTRTRRDSATATLSSASDRTVTGLARGSTVRTVNSTSSGTETTNGKNSSGTFVSVRVVGDTVTGVTVPITDGRPTYPSAGTVIRSMKVTATVAGGTPTVSTRREVITYNGTATATSVITENSVTKTCSVPLPRGRPTCR
jgi:hypothetical protein